MDAYTGFLDEVAILRADTWGWGGGMSDFVTPDGNGNWVDSDGNVYNFIDEQDAYDAEGNSYYWHGEAADVYYMPVQ